MNKIKQRGMKKIRIREKIDGWLFILPLVISTVVFFLGPLLFAFILSFKEYSFLDANSMFDAKWVGISNYTRAFQDPTFIKALKNIFIYALGVVPIQLIIALLLAMVVNGNIKGKAFFRTAYYIPTITSTVAVSVMFLFIFKPDGLFNKFIENFGFKPILFFGNVNLALPTIMMMAIWSSVGVYMVIFLAGLQDIPQSLYEASSIDGANKRQRFWYVTFPLLKQVVFFNFVVSVIGCLQVFDQAYVVSGGAGGPLNSTMTVVLYLYRTGFRNFEMGYACAMAFILFIIILILTMLQKKLFGEETAM
jgi:ABC-type sugar transport systems, permease components